MKSYVILEPASGKLYLLNEQGQLQEFDLNGSLLLSHQAGNLSVSPLTSPLGAELVRTITLDPTLIHLNCHFDGNAQVLSIVCTPIFPSTNAAVAGGGGKMKLGSVDLTLSRNTLAAATTNMGKEESATERNIRPESSLMEWLLLDLSQFNLVVETVDGLLVLSTFAVPQGDTV